MEGYLEDLRSLRSQMNDIEEDAAKRSVDEQSQKTAIDIFQKDLLSVKSETTRMEVEAEEMEKQKTQICCQIEEKQKKIFALEIESVTLSQTLELLQKDVISVLAELEEKRSYYNRNTLELTTKLQERQDWLSLHEREMIADTQSAAQSTNEYMIHSEGDPTEEYFENMGEENERYEDLMAQLESAQTVLRELEAKKSNLPQLKELVEWKQIIEAAPPELKAMDVSTLEEEHKALLTDKAGEMEFLQSLKDQVDQLKGISQVVRCQCGERYTVDMGASRQIESES